MTTYLIRHGLAAAGTQNLDPGLSDVGHRQAAATAKVFEQRGVGRLVVSPLRRTRETAEPIAASVGLEAEIREEVAEVFPPDMPGTQRTAMIGPFMAGRWSEQDDTLRAWRRRVLDTLLEMGLAAAAANHDLVIVSHYIAIGVAIGEATSDDRVVPVPIANTSITVMDTAHGGLRLLEAASVAHLPDDLVTGLHQAFPGMKRE
jgi:broad specificity phosphatase PhoE